jgi:hypothetical protein
MKKIIAILFSTLFLANANDSSSEDGLTLSTEAIVSDYGDIRFENASEKLCLNGIVAIGKQSYSNQSNLNQLQVRQCSFEF